MAKNKFYVVWKGHQTGLFTDWPSTQAAVHGFEGAQYKGFATEADALAGQKMGYFKAINASKTAKPSSKSASAKKHAFVMPTSEVVIYADGACDPNPGQAGTGLALYRSGELSELYYGCYQAMGTNNTAELNGLIAALQLAAQAQAQKLTVTVLCDSQYAINCVKTWAKGWAANNWTRKGDELKNKELIQQAYALWQPLEGQIALEHVAGHAGIEGNELADRMSVYAIEQQTAALARYSEAFTIAQVLAMRAG